MSDDESLALKARIAPHGDVEDIPGDPSSDSALGIPVGIQLLISPSYFFVSLLHKWEVKSAFLQTDSADQDVYVIPPRESAHRRKVLWPLLTASYRSQNGNSKWKAMRDTLLTSFGLAPAPMMPQIFILCTDDHMIVLASNILDDTLLIGLEYIILEVIEKIDGWFTLGTVVHGPGTMRFFGINLP